MWYIRHDHTKGLYWQNVRFECGRLVFNILNAELYRGLSDETLYIDVFYTLYAKESDDFVQKVYMVHLILSSHILYKAAKPQCKNIHHAKPALFKLWLCSFSLVLCLALLSTQCARF